MISNLTNEQIKDLMDLLGKFINDKDKMIEIIEEFENDFKVDSDN
jgi:hypothetical protein